MALDGGARGAPEQVQNALCPAPDCLRVKVPVYLIYWLSFRVRAESACSIAARDLCTGQSVADVTKTLLRRIAAPLRFAFATRSLE